MRLSARVLTVALSLIFLVSSLSPAIASAQSTPAGVNPYNIPNAESNVPVNQHTRVQSLVIDLMSATFCILVGIDPIDKNKACIDVNQQTGQLSYNTPKLDEQGNPHVGGVTGAATQLLGAMYTPTIGTSEYIHYYAQNFGIVKPAYAQNAGYGFEGLTILLPLWASIRNMAYFLLMVAFIIIGLGIMLRVKVDPRTIMTLQNQIPRIIVCILLVTFSYGIAGVMIDMMWLTTYVGINVITSSGGTGSTSTNPTIPGDKDLKPATDSKGNINPNRIDAPLSQRATANLLQTPITYFNQVFRAYDPPGSKVKVDSGIGHMTEEVAVSLGSIIENLLKTLFGGSANAGCGILKIDACFASLLGFIARILFWIIILIIILKTLFGIWFTLLKAYTYIIIYTVGAPFFIVMGLLPGKPLGFEKWMRSMLANLAVFPVTAFIFVIARLFLDLFSTAKDGDTQFVPPLVGQPNVVGLLGVLIAFGLLLMTPSVLAQLQEALKVPGNKFGGAAIGGAIAAGAAAPKAMTGAMWKKGWQKRDQYQDAGWVRRMVAGTPAPHDAPSFVPWKPSTWKPGIQRLRNKADKNPDGKSH